MRMRTIEISVGGFVLAGILALVFLALQVSGVNRSQAAESYMVKARFDDVAGLRVGHRSMSRLRITPYGSLAVRINGIPTASTALRSAMPTITLVRNKRRMLFTLCECPSDDVSEPARAMENTIVAHLLAARNFVRFDVPALTGAVAASLARTPGTGYGRSAVSQPPDIPGRERPQRHSRGRNHRDQYRQSTNRRVAPHCGLLFA